jgi:hypothetical protein
MLVAVVEEEAVATTVVDVVGEVGSPGTAALLLVLRLLLRLTLEKEDITAVNWDIDKELAYTNKQ